MVTQWFHVIIGAAAGFVAAAFSAVGGWLALQALGLDDPTTPAALVGLLVGAIAGGYVAGRMTLRSVFHGALAGVALTGGAALVAISSGGAAPVASLLGLFVGGLLAGGVGGWASTRRRRS